MSRDPIEAIARATLYEGYVLWPYRRSALKNRRRWTFGGVYPRGFCEEAGESDAWQLRCEVLVEGGAYSRVEVELRYLQLVHRQMLAPRGPKLVPVDALELRDGALLSWDEATERRHRWPAALGALLVRPAVEPLSVPAGRDDEEVRDGDGRVAGGVHRSWAALEAEVQLSAQRLGPRLCRLCVRVTNQSRWRGRDRGQAQRRALLSTHLVLRARGGSFHSLTDPPADLTDDARACRNTGVWPVLVGERGRRDTLLASPIILEDYPCVAPESLGDMFDGGEIDQLLLLNVACLSEAEQREMAGTDPHTRAILERARSLSRDELMRLHGTFRE